MSLRKSLKSFANYIVSIIILTILFLDLDSSKQKRLLNVIQTQIDEYYLEQN